jgi:hypothetical protein
MKTSDLSSPFHIFLLISLMPISRFCVAMISLLKVGVRVMLNNDKSGNTQVLDSSLVERTVGK